MDLSSKRVSAVKLSLVGLYISVTCAKNVNAEVSQLTDCTKVNSCSCRSSTLGVVDLSPLANSDGSPRFLNKPFGVEEYSWNPCSPFSEGNCENVAVCQKISFSATNFFSLGTQDTAEFTVSSNGLVLSYSANTLVGTNFLRTAYIKLVCDVDKNPGEFVALGEDPASYGNYHFTLTSVHACPDKLKNDDSPSDLSLGTCLLITLSVVLVQYLIVGAAVQVFVFKKSGCDAIPNKTIWVALPGYVKDGVIFTLRRGKSTTYEEFK